MSMPSGGPPEAPDPDESIRVRMRDGVFLVADVYRPRARSRVPVVMIRTPYGRRAAESPVPKVAARLRGAGFVVLVQDVRGLGQSQGHAAPFVHEVEDARDTLDWLVAQPWCNGKVACWGNSYYGFTAWAAVATRHWAVRALVSRVSSCEPRDFACHEGVLRLGPMAQWACSTWAAPGDEHAVLDWSVRPWQRLIRTSRARNFLLRQGGSDWDALYAALRGVEGAVPTLHWVGWFDLFAVAQMRQWRAAVRGGSQQVLYATASDHMDDRFSLAGRQPDHLIDPAAQRLWLDRTLDPVIDFLRAQLGGASTHLPPVSWELAGVGQQWTPAWPPATGSCRRWYPVAAAVGGNHALRARPARAPACLSWEHDPDHPVPTVRMDWWRPLLDPGDARSLLPRADVLSFTTEPMAAAVDWVGPVNVTLALESTAAVRQVVVTLCDVDPLGVSRILLQAPCRTASADGPLRVHLGEIAYRQPTGHRLRLHVASSCFPLYALPFDGGAEPWLATRFSASRQTLDLRLSVLTLMQVSASC